MTSQATVNVVDITDTPTVTSPAAAMSVNAPNFTLQGTADAGSLVSVYNDVNHNGTVDLGESVVGTEQLAAGQTSYSIAVPLTQSSPNYFIVTALAAPANVSVPAVVPILTADSTAPSFPTVTGPAAPVSLNAATATVTGIAEANSLVEIYEGGAVVASQQLTGGATSYSIAAPLVQNAVNYFSVTAKDAAGNESVATAVPAVTEDSSPPAPPGGTNPSVPTSINTSTTMISGTAEAGSLVKIYDDANDDGSIDKGEVVVGMLQLAPGQTAYSITVPLVQNAANNFLVTDTDEAGNASSPAVVPTITENSIPPANPTVVTPGMPLAVNAGAATITGTAQANSLVKVYKDFNNNGAIDIGDGVVGTLQLTGGATAYSVIVPLDQNAVNHFLVTATDAAGNLSNPVVVPTITEDSTTPPVPRVITPARPIPVDTPTALITGVAQANSLVQVYEDLNNNGGIDAGELVVASQQLTGGATNFEIATPLALNAANYFLVTATNAAGTESAPLTVPMITEDSVPPVAPTGSAPAAATTVDATTYTLTGTAEAGSLVRVYSGATVVSSEQLAPGQTSYSIVTPLTQNAPNNFMVTATDPAGNPSVPAAVPTVTEDSIPPVAPIGSLPASATTVNGATYTLTGTAEAGSLVRVYADTNGDGVIDDGDALVGNQQLAPGQAEYSITVPLASDAANRFLLADADAAGNISSVLAVPTITQNSIAPTIASVRRFGYHMHPTYLVLSFDGQMDPARVLDAANYRIVDSQGHAIRIASVQYDPAANAVTIAPASRLNIHRKYRLTVSGTGPRGLDDVSGNMLDGLHTGHAGSNFKATIDRAILAGQSPFTPVVPAHAARTASVHHAALDSVLAGGVRVRKSIARRHAHA